jgi:predicted permease
MNDLRFAVRIAVKDGRFAAVVIGLLAIGIGLNVTFFSIFDATLLRPLPVQNPNTLVRMVQRFPKIGSMDSLPSAYYEDLAKYARTLSAVFGEAHIEAIATGLGPPETVRVYLPTPQYFEALHVRALYGRTLQASDANASESPPAVLSYAFWRRKFGDESTVLGKSIYLNNHPFVIVGVLPREFNGLSADNGPDVRVPFRALPSLWNSAPGRPMQYVEFELAGRLKPGVMRDQAQSECLALWRSNVDVFYPNQPQQARFERQIGMALDPLDHGVSLVGNRYESTLKLLLASGAILWLIVCVTVGGLLLARGATRRQEFAVRLALGATAGRLARLLFVENLLTAALGLVGGLAIAYSLPKVLIHMLPPIRDFAGRRISLSLDLSLHRSILLFSFATAAVTVLLIGVAPAVAALRVSTTSILRESRSSARLFGRHLVVACQVGLCTTVLVVTGLLARTIAKLSAVDPGFDQDHIVTFRVDPSLSGYTSSRANAFIHETAARIAGLPGVNGVGLSMVGVMRGRGISMTMARTGSRAAAADHLNVSVNYVSTGYFRSMGLATIAGPEDLANERLQPRPRKVVVNRLFAKHFFDKRSPLGETVGSSEQGQIATAEYVISAVVSDSKYRSLRESIAPTVYILTDEFSSANVTVRARYQPTGIINAVRRTVGDMDPAMPVLEISTLKTAVNASTAGERIAAVLATGFSGVAALLTGLGIFGIVTYAVQQRRPELGLRMALGAGPWTIVILLVRQACLSILPGIALGVTAAAFLSPVMRTMMYEVSCWDWLSFGAAVSFVLLVSVVSLAAPLRSAIRTQPAEALRQWE